MTTEKEIDAQLQREIVQPYMTAIFKEDLPQDFVDIFKKAIMEIPPAKHHFHMPFIESIINKKPHEINNFEAFNMINVIYSAPFSYLYNSLEEGIETTKKFDVIRDEYNTKNEEMEKMKAKRKSILMKISGIGQENTARLIAK